MPIPLASQVRAALVAGGVTIGDVGLLGQTQEPPPGSFLVARPDGRTFRLLGVPAGEESAATALVLALDLTALGQTQRQTLLEREAAKQLVAFLATDLGKALRAEASVLLDEINALRQWLVAFKVQVAAATTLADLKTRVASLPNLPDRTLAQAKTAILAAIDSGSVDGG